MRLLWYVSRRSQPSTASPEVGMAFLISKWARMPMTSQVNGTKNGCIMKNFNKIFFAAVAAAFGLASCSQELTPVEKPQGNLVTVNFGAEASIEPATKATLTTEDELTFKSAWENGDIMSVKYSNGNEANGTVPATWNASSQAFEATLPEYTGMWDYNTVYPAPDADGKVDFGSVRTQKGNAYNSNYDLMKGAAIAENAAAGKDDNGKNIIFEMTRQTAVAYFHLTGTLDEEVVSAKLSVEGGNISSSLVMLLDHTDGFDLSTEDLNEITITFEEGTAPKASDFQLWFNVLPTKYTKMTLAVETTGHTMTISRTAADMYEAGKLYKVVKAIPADKWVKKGGDTPKPSVIEDVLTADKFTATGTTYKAFTGVKATSSAVYAGSTAKNSNGAIQLRSSGSKDGIVTTTSGGSATRVSVVWGKGNSSARTIDIYGKSTAYKAASDLYASETNIEDPGTKIGSVVYGTSTELVIEGDYPYIGIRSNNGALYLDSITITWGGAKTATPEITIDKAGVVSISCATAGATIHYTVGDNPADPTESDAVFSAVTLTDGQTIKAIAVAEGYQSSAVASKKYTVNVPEPKSYEWVLTTKSDAWTNNGCVTYFTQPYGIKKVNAYIVNKSISDFANASKISISVKSLCNGGTTSQLTIYLVDANGKAIGEGKVITPDNKSQASQTTYKEVVFDSVASQVTGMMVKCTKFEKNVLINGVKYTVTY